ncbi:MAG: outer membrane beta-barrel protein [Candidatus Aminicenantes bacterium]|nr:outer membrane beta-barrel protein [Candidatus Aminicenantes bacterium]
MTARKVTIAGVIILLSCMTVLGQSTSKFKLFVYSGVTFPSYPSNGFASFFRPTQNCGVGLNYRLSPKLSLTLDFSHYQFQPKSKSGWDFNYNGHDIEFTKVPFPPSIIEVDYDRNDLLLKLKLKPFQMQKRLSPYIIAGGGMTYKRIEAYRDGLKSTSWYKSKSIDYLLTAGIGFDYRIENKIDIFMEACYNYSFFEHKELTRGVIPLKLGIALGL